MGILVATQWYGHWLQSISALWSDAGTYTDQLPKRELQIDCTGLNHAFAWSGNVDERLRTRR